MIILYLEPVMKCERVPSRWELWRSFDCGWATLLRRLSIYTVTLVCSYRSYGRPDGRTDRWTERRRPGRLPRGVIIFGSVPDSTSIRCFHSEPPFTALFMRHVQHIQRPGQAGFRTASQVTCVIHNERGFDMGLVGGKYIDSMDSGLCWSSPISYTYSWTSGRLLLWSGLVFINILPASKGMCGHDMLSCYYCLRPHPS